MIYNFPETPRLSVLIPWSNRDELKVSLAKNQPLFNSHDDDLEVVIINCGGDQNKLSWCLSDLNLNRFKIVHLTREEFNKPLGLNIGAYVAEGEYLFLLDADIILEADFLQEATAKVKEGKVVIIERVFESVTKDQWEQQDLCITEYSQVLTIKGAHGTEASLVTSQIRLLEGSRNASGLVFVARNQFIAVNGMNSNLKGWGWEDMDLLARLQLKNRLQIERLGSVIHISHRESARDWNGMSHLESEQLNYRGCLLNYCRGDFDGTYASDVEEYERPTDRLRPPA
jgi:glycosyltransferase involved in cell wall biosynthesis